MAIGQNKHYVKATKNQSYDDSFESVMNFVETHVGTRKIKNDNDLRKIFEDLNAKEERQGKAPRLSDKFIEIMVEKAHSKGYIGKKERTVGSENVSKREQKATVYRQKGKEVYVYSTHRTPFNDEGGYNKGYENNRIATKTTYKTASGKTIVQFRDVETGRFLSKEQIKTARDYD